jgi:hypothetical protein
LSSSFEENNDPVFTGNREEAERDLSVFISSFEEGTTRHLSNSSSVRKIKRYSEVAARELGGKGDAAAKKQRGTTQSLGPFTGFFTEASLDQNFYGDEQLTIDVYGNEQIEAGLDDVPALRIELQSDGEFSIYAPPSSSETYKEFIKRG